MHHAGQQPWPGSIRRRVLVDLAFALVTAAYQGPQLRAEVRRLVRARLDAAVAANRLVTIEESLARLMMVTPGCQPSDRDVSVAALARVAQANQPQPKKRRWWQLRG